VRRIDNAQRVHELGFGVRLPTFEFEDSEVAGAIERLLSDQALRQRLAGSREGCRLRREPSVRPT
jgi:UDP:flavonoid glycosyltransferase YjiC (YdhE family)